MNQKLFISKKNLKTGMSIVNWFRLRKLQTVPWKGRTLYCLVSAILWPSSIPVIPASHLIPEMRPSLYQYKFKLPISCFYLRTNNRTAVDLAAFAIRHPIHCSFHTSARQNDHQRWSPDVTFLFFNWEMLTKLNIDYICSVDIRGVTAHDRWYNDFHCLWHEYCF